MPRALPNKSIRTTVYLEKHQHDQLKKLSTITRVPYAAFLREAADEVLRKYGARLEGVRR